MATSGTLAPGGGYQGRTDYMTWSLASQSVAGNYSVINWYLYASGGSASWYYHYKDRLWIYGAWRYDSQSRVKRYTGLIASGSITISHDVNGKASFGAELYANVYTASQNVSGSNTWALPDIPRVSDLSVNKASVPADGTTTVTATATKKSSAFTDTITVTLGSYSKTVTSGKAFTIPIEWCNAMPKATSMKGTVTVTTKSGSTVIGSKSVDLTVTVPDDVKPTISDVTITESVKDITKKFGDRYLKGQSKLNVSISAAGAYGSTITAYSTQIDGTSYSDSAFTSNALTKSGTCAVNVTVTDSRGRTASTSRAVTVVDYEYPSITIDHDFCNADGTINSAGTNSKLTMHGVVYPVDGVNTKSLTIKYKSTEMEDYKNLTVDITELGYTFDTSIIIANTDPTITWEFIATLTDKLKSTPATVKTGIVTMSRHAGGDGVTFGGEAEESGLVIKGWNLKMIGGDILINDPELEALADSLFG